MVDKTPDRDAVRKLLEAKRAYDRIDATGDDFLKQAAPMRKLFTDLYHGGSIHTRSEYRRQWFAAGGGVNFEVA